MVNTGCKSAGRPWIFYPHVCEEAARDPVFLPVLPVCSSRHDASNSFRQFGSFVCLRRMGSLLSLPLDRVTRQLIFLSPKKHFFCACPHSWENECTCRPGFTSGAPCYRWDARSRFIRIHLFEILFSHRWPSLLRGPLRDHFILFSLLRSRGIPRGCLGSFFRLEAFPADICFSASCIHANGLLEGFAASRVQWFY